MRPQARKKRKLHCPLAHQGEVGEMKLVEFYSPKDSRHRPTDFKDAAGSFSEIPLHCTFIHCSYQALQGRDLHLESVYNTPESN